MCILPCNTGMANTNCLEVYDQELDGVQVQMGKKSSFPLYPWCLRCAFFNPIYDRDSCNSIIISF